MTTDLDVVCHESTTNRRNVSSAIHKQAFSEYGYSFPQATGAFEVDHFIPLELAATTRSRTSGRSSIWSAFCVTRGTPCYRRQPFAPFEGPGALGRPTHNPIVHVDPDGLLPTPLALFSGAVIGAAEGAAAAYLSSDGNTTFRAVLIGAGIGAVGGVTLAFFSPDPTGLTTALWPSAVLGAGFGATGAALNGGGPSAILLGAASGGVGGLLGGLYGSYLLEIGATDNTQIGGTLLTNLAQTSLDATTAVAGSQLDSATESAVVVSAPDLSTSETLPSVPQEAPSESSSESNPSASSTPSDFTETNSSNESSNFSLDTPANSSSAESTPSTYTGEDNPE
jgi:hypothetical protein